MRPRYCREGEGKGQRQRYSEGMCRVFQKVIPELFGGHSLAGLRKCFGQVSNNNKKSCRDATRLPPKYKVNSLHFPCIWFGLGLDSAWIGLVFLGGVRLSRSEL